MKLLLFLLTIIASTSIAQIRHRSGIAITRAEINRLNVELEQKYFNPNYEFTVDEILHFIRMMNCDYPEFFYRSPKTNPGLVFLNFTDTLSEITAEDKIKSDRITDSLTQRYYFLDKRNLELPNSPFLGNSSEVLYGGGWYFKKYNIQWLGIRHKNIDLTNSRYIIID